MGIDAKTEDRILARLDAADTIVSADEMVMRLHLAAGGDPGGRIAVPQIAAVARLARRLKILIARPLLIGGHDHDIRLWVRAKPVDDGVELQFSEWQESPHPEGSQSGAARAAEIALAPEGADWRTDAQMRFVQFEGEAGGGVRGEEFFSILADSAQATQPLASAVSARRPFFSQLVKSLKNDQVFQLSGYPLFDFDGSFLGYRGKAVSVEAAEEGGSAEAPSSDPATADDVVRTGMEIPDFGKRFDLALRQPLGRIIANADTISGQIEGPLRTDYASYAADIANAGRHLMELVDDLADLQAIDRPNFQVASEDIDLADLARRAAGLLSVKAAGREIRIEPPALDENVMAVGEFRRALQIIVNLLNNAIRYAPEQSTIWLRADVEGEWAVLVVADQGHGIALEDQERMFEKFERLGREDAQGSGLGLYISRRLARAMKGDLTVESAPGQGARFSLTLPRAG